MREPVFSGRVEVKDLIIIMEYKPGVFSREGIWRKIFISVTVLGLVSMLFSRFPAKSGDGWYHSLNQPTFAPAYWMPFVMWTLVYILIGISFAIVWDKFEKAPTVAEKDIARTGILLFGAHMVFNWINPLLLIGLHWPKLALIDMLILIGFIIALIFHFRKIDKVATQMLIPYFIWILYAASLLVAIIVLN